MRSRARAFGVALGAAAAMALTGCASPQLGSPHPLADSTIMSASPGPASPGSVGQAPRIPVPLSPARLLSDPCSLLGARQLSSIGLTPAARPEVQKNVISSGCIWTDDTVGSTGLQIDVGVQLLLPRGLTDVYAKKANMVYFVPVVVAGYPGVLAARSDDRDKGECPLDLGIADNSVLLLDYQTDSGAPVCQGVQRLGGEVIQQLKGG